MICNKCKQDRHSSTFRDGNGRCNWCIPPTLSTKYLQSLGGEDYLSQLNQADLKWLEHFNFEFYRGFNLKEEGTIHKDGEVQLDEQVGEVVKGPYAPDLYHNALSRRNDVFNQPSLTLAKSHMDLERICYAKAK